MKRLAATERGGEAHQTEWLRAHPELQLVDRVLTQTSDDEYHCFTVTLFLVGNPTAYLAEVPVQPAHHVARVVPRPTR